MKTFPTRPAHVPEPPKGYVFLGHRRDIKVPESWDKEYSPSYGDRLSFAAYSADGTLRWIEWDGIRAHKHFDGYIAAKPNTPLYNLNKDLLPMNAPATTVKTLKYKIVTRQNGLVAVQITEQSHRGKEFGEKGSDLFGDLASGMGPAKHSHFFVRGSQPTRDNDLMLLTEAEFESFEEEVAAYNSHFSKPAVLRTVVFKYNGGSVRGYRKVEVILENAEYLEGTDCDKGEYRRYKKDRIVGPIDEIKT